MTTPDVFPIFTKALGVAGNTIVLPSSGVTLSSPNMSVILNNLQRTASLPAGLDAILNAQNDVATLSPALRAVLSSPNFNVVDDCIINPAPPPPPPACEFGCNGSRFDGIIDIGEILNMIGAVDSKVGLLSLWAKFNGGDSSTQFLVLNTDSGNRFQIARGSSNTWAIAGWNPAGSLVLQMGSNSPYTVASGYHHLLVEWDLSLGILEMWINDIDDRKTGVDIAIDDFIDFTYATDGWNFGGSSSGVQALDADVSEVYFAQPLSLLGISIEANRRLFIGADLKPVGLDIGGALPTPLIYYKIGNPANNSGSGGNMVLTGQLDLVAGPGA